MGGDDRAFVRSPLRWVAGHQLPGQAGSDVGPHVTSGHQKVIAQDNWPYAGCGSVTEGGSHRRLVGVRGMMETHSDLMNA